MFLDCFSSCNFKFPDSLPLREMLGRLFIQKPCVRDWREIWEGAFCSAHLQLVSSEYLWLRNIHGNLKNEYIYLLIVHTTSDIEGKYADWNFIRMVGKFASFLKPSLPDSKRFISCRLMNIMYWMIDKKFWKVGSLDLNAEFTFVRLLFYNKSLQIEK